MILPLNAVAAFVRTPDNRVIIYPKLDHLRSHRCISEYRMLETTMTWPTLVGLLDGKLENLGNFEVVPD
jgi:hypothetical protein